MAKKTGIGNLLVRSGIIDATGLARARKAQEKHGISLTKALVTLGLSSEQEMATAIAKGMRLEALGLELPEVPAEVAALLSSDFCRKWAVVPLSLQGKILRLVLADPMDYLTIEDAEFRSGKQVLAVVGGHKPIQSLLQQIYTSRCHARSIRFGKRSGSSAF